MPIDSTLSAQHIESLRIEDFIFHVVGDSELGPELLDQVVLDPAQEEFFKKRIIEACTGTQFIFTDPRSSFHNNCSLINSDFINNFVPVSKVIAEEFHRFHIGNTKPGILIVARVTITVSNDRVSLISVLKVDYEEVYQQDYQSQHVALFHKVQKAISGNKDAVQKWALVDLSDTFSWGVLAKDRSKSKAEQDTDKAIGRYFKQYMGVVVRENDSALTRKAISAVNQWAKTYEDIPEEETRSNYRARAINYLVAKDDFDTEEFLDFVVKDESNSTRKEEAKHSLRESLADIGIAGQEFKPKRDSIPSSQGKTKIETVEGATIVWNGIMEDAGIERRIDNGLTKFIITASEYEEK